MRKSNGALDILLTKGLLTMNNKVDFDNYTDNYNDLLRESTSFFSVRDFLLTSCTVLGSFIVQCLITVSSGE